MKWMRGLSWVLILFFISFCMTSISFAAEDEALVARGKELFTNKAGLNVKIACILCHQGDKALSLEKIKAHGDALPDVINKYIVEKSKGTALANDSEEMKTLVAYLRSGQN